MSKIVVLGSGLVGKAIAADLSKQHDVTSVDINPEILREIEIELGIKTIMADLKKKDTVSEIVKYFDMVVLAVPGFMGYKALKSVINAGKNVVDISFFPEDPFELDKLALKNKVTAVVDCGVAPGMSNLILGYHYKRMSVESFEFMVGGLPLVRKFPFQYKAPFSPVDVLEEYTRPARFIENGKLVIKPAMSEQEYIDFDEIGTLEAFNTDGLRTLLKTMKIHNMKEKTLRYLGHIDVIKVLRDTGFLETEYVDVKGHKIRPIDLTSKLLFNQWKLGKEEEEFTVMKVIIEGIEEGKATKYVYDLLDRYDKATKTSSMARTTGYTAAAAANLILDGLYTKPGITPPEYIGVDENSFKFIINYLKDRKVNWKFN